jgi:hypothetical protein
MGERRAGVDGWGQCRRSPSPSCCSPSPSRCRPRCSPRRRRPSRPTPSRWPERPEHVERFSDDVPGYARRHRVRVGLTGLAQVHGSRGVTDIAVRAQLDNAYIDDWSLGLDLRILGRTAGAVLRGAE